MRRLFALLSLLLAFPFGACSDDTTETPDDLEVADAEGPLVIYSGRRDVLVGPLVERFKAATGLDVEVRYGTDAELIAALAEEGQASPADLFWANTAGALGAAGNAGLLVALPDSLRRMPAAFVPSSGRWVPVTTRFRVLAYHPERVDTTALPASVMGLPQQTALRGRIGWTPTYSSFQDFITAMRLGQGEEATAQWLRGMTALAPKAYESNTPMLEALAAGEIDVALTNHYYVLRMLHGGEEGEVEDEEEEEDEEQGARPDVPVAMHHFAAGDVGNLALVTGAGLLATSTHRTAARRFLAFLLSDEAQDFAADEVHEYPVVPGVALPAYFLPFDRAVALSPSLDFERLSDLETTLDLLRAQGLL